MMHQAVFKKVTETPKGTYLQVFVPGIKVPDKFFINGLANGVLAVDDGRTISGAQRGLLYALFDDIRQASGERIYEKEKVKKIMKTSFISEKQIKPFSLSNVSMELANEFIDYVLEFTFIHKVPLKFKTFEAAREWRTWSYLCFKHRECTICRKEQAQVHHITTVGMGRNRNKVDHSKMLLIMLCADHHQKAHSIGWETFSNYYHVAGTFIPIEVLRGLNIRGEYGEEANI